MENLNEFRDQLATASVEYTPEQLDRIVDALGYLCYVMGCEIMAGPVEADWVFRCSFAEDGRLKTTFVNLGG